MVLLASSFKQLLSLRCSLDRRSPFSEIEDYFHRVVEMFFSLHLLVIRNFCLKCTEPFCCILLVWRTSPASFNKLKLNSPSFRSRDLLKSASRNLSLLTWSWVSICKDLASDNNCCFRLSPSLRLPERLLVFRLYRMWYLYVPLTSLHSKCSPSLLCKIASLGYFCQICW